MWSYSTIKARISSNLQDSAGAIFATTTDGEIDLGIKDAGREVCRFVPHIVRVIYKIESRTGTATSDSTSHLVDTTEAQFLSTDVGKVVYNSDDKKYAVIAAYTSTSDVTLSADIFPDGNENYEIYNENCHSNKEINIQDITDYYSVHDVEYPIGTKRNFSIDGDILTIGIDFDPNDSDTADTDSDVDIHVYFNKRHKVSQLTTLTGAVNQAVVPTGYFAGDTSMVLDTLQTSGTIEEGQEFTVAYRKEIYTVTADATITTSAATISFYPGLEADVANNDVVTFKQSTLTPALEPLFCDYVATKLLISKAVKPMQETINAISVLATIATAIGDMSLRIEQSASDLTSGRTEAAKIPALIDLAATQIGKVHQEVELAIADLDSGRADIEATVSPFGDVSARYREYAAQGLGNANGRLNEAQGYFRQAQADESAAASYGLLAARELSNAAQYLNQAGGYLRKISGGLSIASAGRQFQEKGERDLVRIRQDLSRLAKPKAYKIRPRT